MTLSSGRYPLQYPRASSSGARPKLSSPPKYVAYNLLGSMPYTFTSRSYAMSMASPLK